MQVIYENIIVLKVCSVVSSTRKVKEYYLDEKSLKTVIAVPPDSEPLHDVQPGFPQSNTVKGETFSLTQTTHGYKSQV